MNHENEPVDDVPQTEAAGSGRRVPWRLLLVMAVMTAVVGLWWMRRGPRSAGRVSEAGISQQQAPDPADRPKSPEAPADQLRNAVIGDWKLERNGQRLLSLRADGTATMDVTLTAWQAVLFGEQMRFDIRWSLDGRQLVMETTGGEPATAVDAITKVYGLVRKQPILEIDENHMLLKDPDPGERDHDYRRLRDP